MEAKRVEEIIKKAVREGINAGIHVGYGIKSKETTSYFKQTERLLYSYIDMKASIESYIEEIEELEEYGLRGRSKSIVYMPTGCRLGSEDLLEAKIQDLQYKIQSSEREIKKIDKALEAIKDDEWYRVIELKYFQCKNDQEIAEVMICDPSTVRRNKKRLINKIAVRLYGADALC